jgi:hypothetical protein
LDDEGLSEIEIDTEENVFKPHSGNDCGRELPCMECLPDHSEWSFG